MPMTDIHIGSWRIIRQVRKILEVKLELTLEQVTERCGYASQGALWRLFRRNYSTTTQKQKEIRS